MRRDIGSEVIAAVAAVALLAFAITFGILLSVSDSDNEAAPSPTDEPTVTGVSANVTSDEQEQIATALADTPAVTATATPTENDLAAVASEAVARLTESAATRDAAATEAVTVEPTEDVTTEPTEDITEEPTITPTDTDEPTATNTERPTRTPTNTPTDQPSDTPEPTATNTERPTRTPTNTPTDQPSDTPEPTATQTPAPLPTGTDGCVGAPAGWPVYIVQPNNTLFSIARAVGSTVEELRRANCIPDVDNIVAGDELFVPRLPDGPVQTGVPQTTPQPNQTANPDRISGLQPIGCQIPGIQIAAPALGQNLSSDFEVVGTADLPNFEYYKLEIRTDAATTYNFYSRAEDPVSDGRLGQIDRSLFGSSIYWVRLVVVDNTGNVPPGATCAIPVVLD